MKTRTDHYASFKDPAAKVFFSEDDPGFIFRELSPSYFAHYDFFQSSGLAPELIKKKWLIPFEEIPGEKKILKAKKIEFVSYPYEWTFSQWKEAAMLTMKIQHLALKHGMILKDATPFNIVFDGATPVFVDISSFEIYKEGPPWVAYKQFSENLYLPLLLYKYFDAVANSIYLANSSGIPLYKGLPMLPLKAHFNFSTIFYLTLPSKIRKNKLNADVENPKQVGSFSKKKMIQFSEQLFANISKLNQSKKVSKWNDYYDEANIDTEYLNEKLDVMQSWLQDYKNKTVIDLGCNTGNFSKLAATIVKKVIAFDEDSRSVDELYQHCRENKINNVFTFCGNISAPTPATGWNNTERQSLVERLHGDVTLALALIHHLAITTYISFEMMVQVFSEMSNELIIEFVPPADPRVKLILAGRDETFSWYNEENFMKHFSLYFDVVKTHNFKNNRKLFHFIKKQNAK